MDILLLTLLGVFPALVIVGGLHDLITMKIPELDLAGPDRSLLPHRRFLIGAAPMDVAIHVGIGFVAPCWSAWACSPPNWIGGGDAKLLAASCLWMGMSGVAPFLIYTGIAGGACSACC